MGTNPPQSTQVKKRPLDLDTFKESLLIVKTGADSRGNKYNDIGTLNQAAWIGEHSQLLIDEIDDLQFTLLRVVNLLEHADPMYALNVAREAVRQRQ